MTFLGTESVKKTFLYQIDIFVYFKKWAELKNARIFIDFDEKTI